MTRAAAACTATTLDSIKRSLVGLRMPRALEVLDATVRRIEQGEIDGISALDEILAATCSSSSSTLATSGAR